MEKLFQIGDIVTLKSGSPKMTITDDKRAINLKKGKVFNGKYFCTWFDESKKIKGQEFPQESIEKVL